MTQIKSTQYKALFPTFNMKTFHVSHNTCSLFYNKDMTITVLIILFSWCSLKVEYEILII